MSKEAANVRFWAVKCWFHLLPRYAQVGLNLLGWVAFLALVWGMALFTAYIAAGR